MSRSRLTVQSVEILNRGPHTDNTGYVWRTGFKLVRQLVVGSPCKTDGFDHLATALPRGHGVKKFPLAVKHTDAGWTKQLMPGEYIKVAVQCRHINRPVAHRLGAINQ